MNTIQKRFLLFLIGCIGTRTLLVYFAKNADTTNLQYMGYLATLPAIGFFYLYLTGARKTGGEVFGDKIWWNDIRQIHGILYLIFAHLAINKNKNAWVILLIDIIFGLVMFINHHYTNDNFKYLFEN